MSKGHSKPKLDCVSPHVSFSVLVIDEQPETLAAVTQMLEHPELTLHGTTELNAGVAWAQTSEPDAIFYASASPMVLEPASAAVKRLRRAALHAPLIVLTDGNEAEVELELLRAGADDTLPHGQLTPALMTRTICFLLERKQSLRALEANRSNLLEIAKGSLDGVVVLSNEGTVLFVNPSAESLLGQSREELLDRRFRYPFDHTEPREVSIVGKDGELGIAELRATPIAWEGQEAVLIALRETTELRKMQARLIQADRLASAGALAAGVAHEISNPLSYVIMNLETLDSTLSSLETLDGGSHLLTPRAQRDISGMLEDAREGALRVQKIVRALKLYSVSDGERGWHPLVLDELVKGALELAFHDLKYVTSVDSNLDTEGALVLGDGADLTQALVNLLINASQAFERPTPDNLVTLSTTLAENAVVITVRDTGVGIPEDLLPMVFVPFYTTKVEASGLGLSIAKTIVDSHGGNIAIDSKEGQGTTVTITLPRHSS